LPVVRPVLGFKPEITLIGPLDSAAPEQLSDDALATLRESLSNVVRNAEADAGTCICVARGTCSPTWSNGRTNRSPTCTPFGHWIRKPFAEYLSELMPCFCTARAGRDASPHQVAGGVPGWSASWRSCPPRLIQVDPGHGLSSPGGRQRTCGSRFRTRCRFGLVTCPSSRTVRLEREALAAAFRTAGPDAATPQSSDRAGNRVDAHPVVLHLAQGTWGVATAAGCRRRPRMSRTPLAWVEKARIGRHTTTGIERRRLIARHRSQVPLLTREGSTR